MLAKSQEQNILYFNTSIPKVASLKQNVTLQVILMIVAWACFFMLPFLFFPYSKDYSPFKSERFVLMFITTNLSMICFYYLNAWIFIPKILAEKKTLIYIATIVACFLIYLEVMYEIYINSAETAAFLQTDMAKSSFYKGPRFFSTGPMTIFLPAFVVSSGSKVIARWFTAEEIKEEITRQQLQTELSFLKSQVNPHFLFNTLNSIYSLSISNNKKTSDAVMKLSRIMRYTLEESQKDVVTVGQEIDFINSYIELQKLRLTDNVNICFKTCDELHHLTLAPLLFIPFIENAFKYGISTHHNSRVDVRLYAENNNLVFNCKNGYFPSLSKVGGTGTGIMNTKRRLELLYPQKHQLVIQQTETHYEVTLILNLFV